MKDAQAYELLLRSLDEPLKPEEQVLLDAALLRSEDLRKEQAQLLTFRRLAASQHYQFRPFFAGRVMNRIMEQAYGRVMGIPILPSVFKRVAIPALAVIVVLLMGVYFMDGSLSVDAVIGTNGLSLSDIEENYWVNL
jgi:hypothetical protein